MKKLAFSIAALAALFLASPALAVDSMKGFDLSGKAFVPNDMPCEKFLKADNDMQMLVSAWFDGNSSTFNPIPRAQYMIEDVISMHEALIKACKSEPDSTLGPLGFDYGGDGDSARPTCGLLTKMPDVNKASLLLAWSLGYVNDSDDGTDMIDLPNFADFGNAIFKECKANPNANLLNLVLAYQGLGGDDSDDSGGKDISN